MESSESSHLKDLSFRFCPGVEEMQLLQRR